MPRWITSSVSSWAVQWVIGRPDFSGGSQATARIWVTCSGVNLPGAPGRGSSLRTASMARRKSARDSQHSMSMSRFHASAQRRRQRPTWRCVRPTLLGDVFIEKAVEGQDDDRGALPEPRGCGDGTGEGLKDFLLTLGDGDLGRLARHGERTPGDWEDSQSR